MTIPLQPNQNPSNNPIALPDGAWNKTYTKDLAAADSSTQREAGQVTNDIYDGLHGLNGQTLATAQAAVTAFSNSHQDANGQTLAHDLQALQSAAVWQDAGFHNAPENEQLSAISSVIDALHQYEQGPNYVPPTASSSGSHPDVTPSPFVVL